MAEAQDPATRDATAALRERSRERLQLGFRLLVEQESSAQIHDGRDAMISVTPFVDCARRIGLDPAEVLGPIAETGAHWFREMFDRIVRRTDLALSDFGWRVVETADGPAYEFAFPPFGRRARPP